MVGGVTLFVTHFQGNNLKLILSKKLWHKQWYDTRYRKDGAKGQRRWNGVPLEKHSVSVSVTLSWYDFLPEGFGSNNKSDKIIGSRTIINNPQIRWYQPSCLYLQRQQEAC